MPSGKTALVALAFDLDWPLAPHSILAGIRRYAEERNAWRLTVDPFVNLTMEMLGRAQPYVGVIGYSLGNRITDIARRGMPAVNTSFQVRKGCGAHIRADFKSAGRVALNHLIDRGHRNLLTVAISSPAFLSAVEGARGAAARAGLSLPVHTMDNDFSADAHKYLAFFKKMSGWLGKCAKPLGVLTTSDPVARYIVNICAQRGLRIPEDVAIVSIGNVSGYCETSAPGISSVDLRFPVVGYRAAAELDRLLRGGAPRSKTIDVAPGEVVTRRSSDVYAVDDKVVANAMRFIAMHYHRPLQVGDVAVPLPVSLRSLERRFARTLGRSIIDELTRVRLGRARELLLNTDLLVKEIAAETGFERPKQLARAFRQHLGVSPAEFRKRT